jgi:hypothetical protein
VLLQEQPAVILSLERTLVSWPLAIDERDGHRDLRGSGRQNVIPCIYERTVLYYSSLSCLCEPEPFSPDPYEVAHARAFYSSRSDNYNEFRGPTGGLKAGQTLCCRPQRLGVINNVFNDVSMPDLVAYHPVLGQWYDVVPLHH